MQPATAGDSTSHCSLQRPTTQYAAQSNDDAKSNEPAAALLAPPLAPHAAASRTDAPSMQPAAAGDSTSRCSLQRPTTQYAAQSNADAESNACAAESPSNGVIHLSSVLELEPALMFMNEMMLDGAISGNITVHFACGSVFHLSLQDAAAVASAHAQTSELERQLASCKAECSRLATAAADAERQLASCKAECSRLAAISFGIFHVAVNGTIVMGFVITLGALMGLGLSGLLVWSVNSTSHWDNDADDDWDGDTYAA